MKKILALALFTMLAACGGKKENLTLPPPPKNTEVVQQNIPVPVLCKAEIQRAKVKLDDMEEGKPLEQQNAAMRETIAQLKSYVVALEAGIIGCGGKINK